MLLFTSVVVAFLKVKISMPQKQVRDLLLLLFVMNLRAKVVPVVCGYLYDIFLNGCYGFWFGLKLTERSPQSVTIWRSLTTLTRERQTDIPVLKEPYQSQAPRLFIHENIK